MTKVEEFKQASALSDLFCDVGDVDAMMKAEAIMNRLIRTMTDEELKEVEL
jgi:hypothetical protein